MSIIWRDKRPPLREVLASASVSPGDDDDAPAHVPSIDLNALALEFNNARHHLKTCEERRAAAIDRLAKAEAAIIEAVAQLGVKVR